VTTGNFLNGIKFLKIFKNMREYKNHKFNNALFKDKRGRPRG